MSEPSGSASVQVTVVYPGGSRAQAQTGQEVLTLPAGSTVGDAVVRIGQQHPKLLPYLPSARWARNMAFADADEILATGDELALIPPVCGGAGRTRLQTDPIVPADVLQSVQDTHHGATVLFIGTVRDHNAGHHVEAITYEAYRPMADRALEKIADACCSNGTHVQIVHRLGLMAPGDVTVAIAASHVHRDEAFVACREAIEAIKHQVPIFKKERTPDGDVWVGWGA